MHGRPADAGGLGVQPGAHLGVGGGHVVDAVEQRLEIQHGATHQQRDGAAGADLSDQALGVLHELGRAVRLQRVEDVDQVVGHGGPLLQAGFGGADVHAAVDQGRVHADDFTGLAALGQDGGQGQRAVGFTGSRGACNRNAGQRVGGRSQGRGQERVEASPARIRPKWPRRGRRSGAPASMMPRLRPGTTGPARKPRGTQCH